MDMIGYCIPNAMKLGNVKVYYSEVDGKHYIKVCRINENGSEVSELTPGDLLNAAMLLRRVEAAIFKVP
jgi:hypothetical protein